MEKYHVTYGQQIDLEPMMYFNREADRDEALQVAFFACMGGDLEGTIMKWFEDDETPVYTTRKDVLSSSAFPIAAYVAIPVSTVAIER